MQLNIQSLSDQIQHGFHYFQMKFRKDQYLDIATDAKKPREPLQNLVLRNAYPLKSMGYAVSAANFRGFADHPKFSALFLWS